MSRLLPFLCLFLKNSLRQGKREREFQNTEVRVVSISKHKHTCQTEKQPLSECSTFSVCSMGSYSPPALYLPIPSPPLHKSQRPAGFQRVAISVRMLSVWQTQYKNPQVASSHTQHTAVSECTTFSDGKQLFLVKATMPENSLVLASNTHSFQDSAILKTKAWKRMVVLGVKLF